VVQQTKWSQNVGETEVEDSTSVSEVIDQPTTGLVAGFSRRLFLRGSVGLAAAGAAVAAMPGLSGALAATENEAPEVEDAASAAGVEGAAAGTSNLTEPLIAHVKDLQTGEMSLFFGEKEISFSDPGLASQLFGAARN
jgi:hypothetical protein